MSEHRIPAPDTLDQACGRDLFARARTQPLAAGDTLVVDFAGTTRIDSRGGAWIVRIADHARTRKAEFRVERQAGDVATFLDLILPVLGEAAAKPPRGPGFLEMAGEKTYRFAGEAREMIEMVFDAVYWTALAPFEGRGFRRNLFVDELYEMGVRAVPINALMNFLLGLTIAMMSAAQLRTFGLAIYVADLLVIGFARELAAIMTSVVVSARTGAAIAAELSTMKVQEEIDALRGMGISVPQYLIAPKLMALIVVMPCLVILGLVSGLLGGVVWGVFVLNFRFSVWITQTINAMDFEDLLQGLLKSVFFAAGIVYIGCHNGLRVQGGSRGVGLMTTRAVVMDIFFIIVVDMLFALMFYYVLD